MNQPDFSIYLIFLFGFGVPLLVLPAAYYLRRHWSLQKRLAMAPFLFVVGTILYAALIGANYRKPGNGALAYIFGALWLTQGIMVFYVWRKMSRDAQRAAAASRPPPDNVDSFFWQGLLILLPVVIMAAVAGTAIIKDRSAVEREARQRAEEILAQINPVFGRLVGTRLVYFEYSDLGNWNNQQVRNSLWPGSPLRNYYDAETNRYRMAMEPADSGTALYPDAIARAIKFMPIFDEDGSLKYPAGGNIPRPPAWRMDLSGRQLAAWNLLLAAVTADNGVAEVAAAEHAFLETGPSEDARTNAEFLLFQSRLAVMPTAERLRNAIDFCERQDLSDWFQPGGFEATKAPRESESGIPITSLTVAEALTLAARSGPSELLWRQFAHEVIAEPNFITPVLLDLAGKLTNNDPALAKCLDALQLRWREKQRSWDMAETIQRTGRLHGLTLTNMWLDFEGARWFCILEPRSSPPQNYHGGGFGTTNWFTTSRLFPVKVVTMEFAQALNEARIAIPKYFAVAGVLEGSAPFPIGANTNKASLSGTMLAQESGVVNEPAKLDDHDHEMFPSQPHYELRIYLADSSLMLAAHRQRALLFGGLILASALAAFAGFLAARRAFYRQLRLSEMKSDFVSSVSHELRAPIASVRLMAEGLERGRISEPGKQHEYFKFIVQECRRLSSLIENVLDFSRIEQGRKQYEMESTDLAALTEKTVTLMETYAAERQVNITLKKIGEPAPVELDGKAVQQALVNLIDNAIKHSPKGAEISVGLEFSKCGVRSAECGVKDDKGVSEAAIQLWVEDRGEGIAAAEQEKIFERFYRVGSELRRETQGVGIGLSIVKHIVEAHGGRVTVRSAPGEGSRFTIELPTM